MISCYIIAEQGWTESKTDLYIRFLSHSFWPGANSIRCKKYRCCRILVCLTLYVTSVCNHRAKLDPIWLAVCKRRRCLFVGWMDAVALQLVLSSQHQPCLSFSYQEWDDGFTLTICLAHRLLGMVTSLCNSVSSQNCTAPFIHCFCNSPWWMGPVPCLVTVYSPNLQDWILLLVYANYLHLF